VLVDDAERRAEMARIYRDALSDYVNRPRTKPADAPPPQTPAQQRMTQSVMYLMEHIHEAPILMVPTFRGRCEKGTVFDQASRWGSIAPGIWSFMLALRLHGLGSAWTTLHLHREQEMGELLGIPPTETQAGIFPIAYTVGTDFKPADRIGSEKQIRWNHW
jgi:nitroreductase